MTDLLTPTIKMSAVPYLRLAVETGVRSNINVDYYIVCGFKHILYSEFRSSTKERGQLLVNLDKFLTQCKVNLVPLVVSAEVERQNSIFYRLTT